MGGGAQGRRRGANGGTRGGRAPQFQLRVPSSSPFAPQLVRTAGEPPALPPVSRIPARS